MSLSKSSETGDRVAALNHDREALAEEFSLSLVPRDHRDAPAQLCDKVLRMPAPHPQGFSRIGDGGILGGLRAIDSSATAGIGK